MCVSEGLCALSTVILVLTYLILFVFGSYFIYAFKKNIQPIRARSKVALAVLWITLILVTLIKWVNLHGGNSCLGEVWGGGFLTGALVSIAIARVSRLFFLFHMTKYHLEQEEAVKERRPSKFIEGKRFQGNLSQLAKIV